MRGPLTVVASPVVEHRLRTHKPSGHGSRAQPLRGMWDPPGPGHEPVSPALAGELPTTVPPGKSISDSFYGLYCLYKIAYRASWQVLPPRKCMHALESPR